jgi:predicted Zn-dependent peptidase
VVSEYHPQSLSVALGVFVMRGSRHESRESMGITHFLEHLVFKGTKTRSALDIARSLEVLGGELNAYTTREYTVYHALCLKEHWPKALDVITDLVQGMALTEKDFNLERSVILQEINMSDEDLEDHIHDYFYENLLPENSLGTPILGKESSIGALKRSDLRRYYQKEYTADRIIVAAAGNIQHDELLRFADQSLKAKKSYQGRAREKSGSTWYSTPKPRVFRTTEEKKSEQLHLCMGLPANSYSHKLRFEAYIVNALLGGGMTSRIYQSVREKKGLVYSIYSSLNTFADFGCLNIYAASEHKNMSEVVQTISKQVRKLQKDGVRRAELERFKTQVMGSILLGSEDIENRMSSIGLNEMIFQDYRDIYQVKNDIEKISMDSIHEFIDRYINIDKMAAVVMGENAHRLQSCIENI